MPVYLHNLPLSTARKCFDELLFAADHVGRSASNSYYLNRRFVLRPHMTAVEREYIKRGLDAFAVVGSVFRRDEIDQTHYPIFHQLEGVKILQDAAWGGDPVRACAEALRSQMEGLVQHLFGADTPFRWSETFFPFTDPSYEIEILHNQRWTEILGCGVLQKEVVGREGSTGWAFGVGLERVAMIAFDIPDIRLLWSTDEQFLAQFSFESTLTKYNPTLMLDAKARDISFWCKDESFEDSAFYDLVRDCCGDVVESVKKVLMHCHV